MMRDCHHHRHVTNVWQIWESIIEQVDAVWLIAPETDGLLEKLTRLALKHHKIIVGSDCESIRVTSDKLLTYQALMQAGIDTIPTFMPDETAALKTGQWIAKPRDGAGCEKTHCFESTHALNDWLSTDENIDAFIVQSFQAGSHASISCLMNNGEVTLLSCNQQMINREDGLLQAKGILINGMKAYWSAFEAVANQVAETIIGLSGYVGIDVIVTQTKQILVVEVNPRLTTSYIGLKKATGINPAALCMEIALKRNLVRPNLTKRVMKLDFAHEGSYA